MMSSRFINIIGLKTVLIYIGTYKNKNLADNHSFILRTKMTTILKRRSSNSTSDDDEEVDCPLNGAEALAACKQFASVTNTDSGLAMMMLQKNGWNLERAIGAYQDLAQGKSKPPSKQIEPNNSAPEVKRMKAEETTSSETKVKTRFKILSWNIDGLDEQQNTIEIRTRGIIDIIKR
jgi:hypothetical protein